MNTQFIGIYIYSWCSGLVCLSFVSCSSFSHPVAFICQHNSFLVYDSMEQANSSKWAKVTHISVFGAFIMCAIIGICGYVTFTGHTQGEYIYSKCTGTHFTKLFFNDK